MTVIELTDEQAAALKAKAAAQGLTLEGWLQKLAEEAGSMEASSKQPLAARHISEVICDLLDDVPFEIADTLPADGASQHDHYIYGWPKKEA